MNSLFFGSEQTHYYKFFLFISYKQQCICKRNKKNSIRYQHININNYEGE
jgi:hypothetical protein